MHPMYMLTLVEQTLFFMPQVPRVSKVRRSKLSDTQGVK